MRPVLVLVAVAASSCSPPPVMAIQACPEGAHLVGDAPPKGTRQRCEKTLGVRHGAAREWYDDRRERAFSEWWEGRKHGRFKLWYKNGKARSEGAHLHGAPAGDWSWFKEDGTVLQREHFAASPPAADWLAQALAGHPPLPEQAEPGTPDTGGPGAPDTEDESKPPTPTPTMGRTAVAPPIPSPAR